MKRLSDFMAEEYEKRLNTLSEEVKVKRLDIDELDKHVGNLKKKVKFKDMFAIEKSNSGMRIIAHKSNKEVKLFDQEGNDVTSSFQSIANELMNLSDKDFIVDGDLVLYNTKGKVVNLELDRKKLSEAIDSKSEIKFYLSDLLFFDGTNLTFDELNTRRQNPKKFNYNDVVKEMPMVIIKNKDSAKKAIDIFSKLPGCNGVVVKKFNSKYEINNLSDDCFCLSFSEASENGKDDTNPNHDGTNK